jgi:hypothetical protein
MNALITKKTWTELDMERTVNMRAMGVSDAHILKVVQLDMEDYEKMLASAEFKTAFSEKLYTDAMERQGFDSDWDQLENMALTNLKQSLKYNKDPNLQLRAATMANRATRRVGNMGNQPLNASGGSGRVSITLNRVFVNKVNMATPDTRREVIIDNSPKRVNIMPQKNLNQMFLSEEDKHTHDFAEMLDGVDMEPLDKL